ncbi:hypothetical protein [Neobacillus sp. DY30]|uniref:hypothetical protein n=1 Tax=Neobacillus sp. DY30 TaxID=3047871 RepID=UPI0024C01E02|nr:hypothetical protein [Neobacillus sp. DY30]WHX98981.1 hypothetical protein QNH29_20595 [Neobacillus sp. DY30]
MKRLDFFKEMGNDLFQTVKSVYKPFIKDDIEKFENAADKVLGITWVPLMNVFDMNTNLEMKFFQGKAIIIVNHDTNIQAWNGICPVCSHIITVSALYSSGKCLNCQKEFNFKTNTGELQVTQMPLRKRNQIYQIGIVKGDFHA